MKQDEERVQICRDIMLGPLLGEGGMGRIFEGFESGLGSHAAVKVLREELIDEKEVRARFDEESQLMASIEHPGCLPVYGWGIDGSGRPFYAMRKIAGRTLTDLLEERGDAVKSFVWRRRLLTIFQSVCETIGYAHEQGIVHRDIKPDNVMIDGFGAVYVIDWGIAKRVTEKESTKAFRTLTGAVMGSPGYMAPEQADGRTAKAGPEADVFALGVILYEVLTGESPFRGATEKEAMAHAVNLEPKPPGVHFLVGRSLRTICMKALHKDPSRRYKTAHQLARDIRAYNEGEHTKEMKTGPTERAIFSFRRDPVRAAVKLAITMTILTGLAIVGLQMWIDHRLADKAFDHIAEVDELIAELNDEIAIEQAKLENPGADQVVIGREIEILQARKIIHEVQAMNELRSVKQLRFMRANPKLDDKRKERLFAIFETGAQGPQANLLNALADTILEAIAEGQANYAYSEEDIARLREFERITAEAAGLQ